MKQRNIWFGSLALLALFTLSSCLKDQKDVFEEPASTRVNKLMSETQKVLMSPQYGWLMYYYPEGEQSYGGYVYTLKFGEKDVEVKGEIAPGESATSLYNLTTDNGAVLTFDTYNELMHFFATPSSSLYQAYGGDFEFTIVSATKDYVKLRGKRSGNTIELYPLQKPADEYLESIVAMSEAFDLTNVSATITGGVAVAEFDLDYRQIYLGRDGASDDEIVVAAYLYTENGIRLYQPVTFQGVTFQELTYSEDGASLYNDDVRFSVVLPEGWELLDKYVGDYTVSYASGTVRNVSILKTEKGKLLLRGLHKADLTLYYELDPSSNSAMIGIRPQKVGSNGDYDFWVCAWDTNEGYLTWGTTIGLNAEVDPSASTLTFTLVDNGVWGSYVANALLMWKFNPGSTTSAGNAVGFTDFYFKTNSDRMAGPITFTKVQ